MEQPAVRIAQREIRSGLVPYFVAEIAGNHGGIFDNAIKLIDYAIAAGADAVKTQTFLPDRMTFDSDLREKLAANATPMEWHADLMDYAEAKRITLFSSVFDPADVEFQVKLGAHALKIPSLELARDDLIIEAANADRPVIMSTGMANVLEIEHAVELFFKHNSRPLTLLHCVSAYPPDFPELNLRAMMPTAQANVAVPGFSDHTMSNHAAMAATALGAAMIERHIQLAIGDGARLVEHFAALPREFEQMVDDCRIVFESLGEPTKIGPLPGEAETEKQRIALFSSGHKSRDSVIVEGDLVPRRAGATIGVPFGIRPRELPSIIGRMASRDWMPGQLFDWDMLRSK